MTVASDLGKFSSSVAVQALPKATRGVIRNLLFDVTGLCVAARGNDYVAAARASAVQTGSASAIGHAGGFGPYDAALINGTAAHGEDYDDTFEGGPVHAGAVIVPAVLAIAEERGLSGDAVVRGIAVGVELMCRMSLVAPQAIHKACFHPTAVLGAPSAAAAVAVAIGLDADKTMHAIGISGSLASGIIEYLADGSWTKRLHAGNAAQAGMRAALLAEAGFTGPASVLEGIHGFYKAFAPSRAPDFEPLLNNLGDEWVLETLAFKPYACGTMTQPFIDCAIELAASGVKAEDIRSMVCEVGEGTVHRLWEPLEKKHAPPNGYAGKFSTPYCIAVGFLDGRAGFEQFTDARVLEPKVRALCAKVSYVIDPDNPYPKNFTGHIRATLNDGTVREARKAHMRGGAHEKLSDADIELKYRDNAKFGGWSDEQIDATAEALERIAALGQVDLGVTEELDMRELEGLVAIVTGAARNIGRAIALDLADGGASVAVVTKSDMDGADGVANEIIAKGGNAIALQADVSDPLSVREMVAAVAAKFGRIDILVNNAGVRPESPLEEMSWEEWRAVQGVILDGAFLCAREAVSYLGIGGRGSIVNIGGLTAYTGAANRAHVVSAKAGLDGLTKALAVELSTRNITVNCVSPGLIDTVRGKSSTKSPEHHKTHMTLVGRRGKPEEVASMVRYIVGPKARYITGQTIHVSGGTFLP